MADLGHDLGQVDLADAGMGASSWALVCSSSCCAHGPVQVGDGPKQRAQQPHLGPHQLGQEL
jgi:hypothetical protein